MQKGKKKKRKTKQYSYPDSPPPMISHSPPPPPLSLSSSLYSSYTNHPPPQTHAQYANIFCAPLASTPSPGLAKLHQRSLIETTSYVPSSWTGILMLIS